MAAKFPYSPLADLPEGLEKESELDAKVPMDVKTEGDIERGFVYHRARHVTLRSIANNEKIVAIHAESAPKAEKGFAALNKATRKSWQTWEVPRELPEDLRSSPRNPSPLTARRR